MHQKHKLFQRGHPLYFCMDDFLEKPLPSDGKCEYWWRLLHDSQASQLILRMKPNDQTLGYLLVFNILLAFELTFEYLIEKSKKKISISMFYDQLDILRPGSLLISVAKYNFPSFFQYFFLVLIWYQNLPQLLSQ